MTLSELLTPEFDREMATSRTLLERAPEEKFAWAPHIKSMTLGRLTSHVAELPTWVNATIGATELDLAPPDGTKYQATVHSTRAELLETFDKNVAAARPVLAAATDDELAVGWSLKMGGETLFTQPRHEVLRTWVLNHIVHHRAQLSVYLRLLEVPVPMIYGPSADEGMG
jgi:uncharacterized damage-inducible protein DinB